jgi:hypothetical protein
MQAVVQVVVSCQLPLVSHVCTLLPLHCLSPGVHVVHAPDRQTVVHVKLSCQLPLASQVCRVLSLPGLHCVAPGAHVVQAPLMHAVAVQAGPLFTKLPVLSQRIGWLPMHFLAPGLQSVQFPDTHAAVHVVPF